MTDVIKGAVDSALDKVDATTKAALIAVGASEDVVAGVAIGLVNTADKSAHALTEEAEATRQRLMVLLRAIADTATASLP